MRRWLAFTSAMLLLSWLAGCPKPLPQHCQLDDCRPGQGTCLYDPECRRMVCLCDPKPAEQETAPSYVGLKGDGTELPGGGD